MYRLAEAVVVIVGLAAVMLGTDAQSEATQRLCMTIDAVIAGIFAVDYVATLAFAAVRHLTRVPEATGRQWALSVDGMIGLATFLPLALAAPFAWNPYGAPLFGVIWILRLGRYSPSTGMLVRVLLRERNSVVGVLALFAVVLLLGATLMLVLERSAQPEHFDTMPHTLWWAITTLTTTGYGDMVPVTPLGRMLGGIVMISGIILFGLLAGILATGFSAEVRRQEFLRNWDIVASVPIFHRLGAGTIGELAGLLRRRDLPRDAVVTRKGAPGTSMYFIVSGDVEVELPSGAVRLGPGHFFGEMALLTGAPRSATVVTVTDTCVLELDIADLRMLGASHPELTELIEHEAHLRTR
jgi:voltage-gated potassium channel